MVLTLHRLITTLKLSTLTSRKTHAGEQLAKGHFKQFRALFTIYHLILNIVGFSCCQLFSFFNLILKYDNFQYNFQLYLYEIYVFYYKKGFLLS
jgi:hypothetical protein